MAEMKERVIRQPKLSESILVLAIVVGILVTCCLFLGTSAHFPLLLVITFLSIVSMFLWGYKWTDIEKMMFEQNAQGMLAIIINLEIGFLIASWIISGIVPYIIYLGLFIFTPRFYLVMSLICCCILSLCTGSSWTTTGTLGIALLGIGLTLGVEIGLICGAVFAGSKFGDKQSPISESTNLAAIVAGTTLYEHTHSMLYTSLPALFSTIVLYLVMAFLTPAIDADLSAIDTVQEGLHQLFWFNPLLLIPLALFLFLIIKKAPAIMAMGIAILFGIFFAFTQGFSITEIASYLVSGWNDVNTGVADVDPILKKGGANSMWSTICIMLLGFSMAGILLKTNVIKTIIDAASFIGKSTRTCIVANLITEACLTFSIGCSYIPEMLTGAAFQPIYEKLDLNKKVLSRSCEDFGTVMNLMVPWHVNGVYYTGIFGVPTVEYAKYYYYGFFNSFFAFLNAFTGYGTWYTDGTKRWGKSKREYEAKRMAEKNS